MQRSEINTMYLYNLGIQSVYGERSFPSDKETIESEISWLVVRRPSSSNVSNRFVCMSVVGKCV